MNEFQRTVDTVPGLIYSSFGFMGMQGLIDQYIIELVSERNLSLSLSLFLSFCLTVCLAYFLLKKCLKLLVFFSREKCLFKEEKNLMCLGTGEEAAPHPYLTQQAFPTESYLIDE